MINYEISMLNAMIIENQLYNSRLDFTSPYTFYYDETNNIKTFYVKENDFNYTFTANFVLGGLVHDGNAPEVQELFDSFKLQKTANEVKFKHIAFGDFIDCLKSQKLNGFLHFLMNNNLYVHYSSLNILYWSIVDIVDSAIMNSDTAMSLGRGFADHLKNDLYKLCRLEVERVIELFYTFKYPNIQSQEIGSFIEALSDLFDPYIDTNEFSFGLQSLKQILKESKKKRELAFVMNETDHILLKDLADWYLRPIYTFKTSTHVFDNEDSIREEVEKYRFLDNGIEFSNFSFVDSKDSKLTQLSDIFVGLMGKFTQYRNTHTIEEITSEIDTFSDLQIENLKLFLDVIAKSDQKNRAFIYNNDALDELQKFDILNKYVML